MPDPSTSQISFGGRLADQPLEDIVRALCGQQQSAVVRVETAGDHALIEVDRGQVAAVQYRDLEGENALLRLIALSSGTFEVEFRDVAAPASNSVDFVKLVAEAQKRRMRIDNATQGFGGPCQVLRVDLHRLSGVLDQIPDEVNPLLRLCDGKRTVSEVLAAASFDEVTSLRVIERLVKMLVLIPVPESDLAPPSNVIELTDRNQACPSQARRPSSRVMTTRPSL